MKEANNKTLADTTSQIVAANEARKDAIEQQYQQNKRSIQGQQMQMEAEKSADTANVVEGVAGTAANIAATLDAGRGGSKKAKKMNTNQQLNGIAKDSDDILGLKAKTIGLPSVDDLKRIKA